MDSQPDSNPANAGSILTTGPYPTLNTVAVARLRAFMDALKAEGIYVNLNLHVGYEFRPTVDNVPPMPDGSRLPSQSKPLNIFVPRMIELQKQFTRSVIEALRLNDDPVLAMIEINNEGSLVQEWQSNGLDRTLLGDYRTELQRQWNAFLKAKYSSTEALRAAWGGGESDGPELIPGAAWRAELHPPAQATFKVKTKKKIPTLIVKMKQGGNWAIFKQVGFSVATDRPYLAELEIKAEVEDDVSVSVYWDVKQDVSPWRTAASRTISVTNSWQKFTMAFQPTFAMDGIGRFAVSLENVPGTAWVRRWSLKQAARRGLGPDESIESSNVSLVSENEVATAQRTNDYLLFLTECDRVFLSEMLGAVREKTGPLTPVAGTQMGFGGLLNLDSHTDLDYQDNHFYVDHYGFPNAAWDGRDWYIRDTSSLGSGLTAFHNMAASREARRPFTVSEYNQPWPNTYAAEIAPTLAAFAAFQDWDSIMHFAYSHGRNWDDGVPNGFNINGDWTKFPNIGQAAWLFRTGAVRSALQSIELPVSKGVRLQAAREKRNWDISAFLNSALGFNPANAFVHSIQIAKDDNRPVPDEAKTNPASPYVSDTGELTYDPASRLFTIDTPFAAGVFGFIGSRPVRAGAMGIELVSPRGFGSFLLTPIDGEEIRTSSRLLLTTPGYSLRTQPGSSPPQPQKLVKYGSSNDWWTLEKEPAFPSKPSGNLNGGVGPTWMERIESYITLYLTASELTVYPLDGAGARMAPLKSEYVQGLGGEFRVHLQTADQPLAPWYEITVVHGLAQTKHDKRDKARRETRGTTFIGGRVRRAEAAQSDSRKP
jgi:hypothetical protein